MYKLLITIEASSAMPSHAGGHLNMHLRRTNNSDDYCENSPSRDVAREARYSVAGEKREVLQGVHHGSQSRRQTDVEIPIHMSNNQNGATEDNASGRRAPGKQKQGRHLHVHLVKVKKNLCSTRVFVVHFSTTMDGMSCSPSGVSSPSESAPEKERKHVSSLCTNTFIMRAICMAMLHF